MGRHVSKMHSGVFSTERLNNALEKKRAANEKIRRETLRKAFSAIAKLSKQIEFEDAYIFGSLAKRGAYHSDSDADICFAGLKDCDVLSTAAFLSNELGVEVDVVQIEKFRQAVKIRKEGIKWKKKSSRS